MIKPVPTQVYTPNYRPPTQVYTPSYRPPTQVYTPSYRPPTQVYTPSYRHINVSNNNLSIKPQGPNFIDPNIQIKPVIGTSQHVFDLFNMNKYNLFNNRDSTNLLTVNKSSYQRRKNIVADKFVTYEDFIASCPNGINCPQITKIIITGGGQLQKLPNTIRQIKFRQIHGSLFDIRTSDIPKFITHIDLDDESGYHIVRPNDPFIFSDSVTHLKFPRTHYKNIVLPKNLTHLRLPLDYDKMIVLPESLLYVEFGRDYNQPTILPKNLKMVQFGYNYNQPTDFPD
jgi:hypothetical protein